MKNIILEHQATENPNSNKQWKKKTNCVSRKKATKSEEKNA